MDHLLTIISYCKAMLRNYLHITNKQCKQNQSSDGYEDGKENLSNEGACFKVLSKRAVKQNLKRKYVSWIKWLE